MSKKGLKTMKIVVKSQDFIHLAEWVLQVGKKDGFAVFTVNTDGTATLKSESLEGLRSASLTYSSSRAITESKEYTIAISSISTVFSALQQKRAEHTLELDFSAARFIKVSYEKLVLKLHLTSDTAELLSNSERFAHVGTVNMTDFTQYFNVLAKVVGNSTIASSFSTVYVGIDRKNSSLELNVSDKMVIAGVTMPYDASTVEKDEDTLNYKPQLNSKGIEQCILLPRLGFKNTSETAQLDVSDASLRFTFENGDIATIRRQNLADIEWWRMRGAFFNTDKTPGLDCITSVSSLMPSVRIAQLNDTGAYKRNAFTICTSEDSATISDADDADSAVDQITVHNMLKTADSSSVKFFYDEFAKAMSVLASKTDHFRITCYDSYAIIIGLQDNDEPTEDTPIIISTAQ